MAVQFDPVQPGDLITSDLFNRLLAEFNSLRDRVTALEGSASVGEVGIQGFVPDGAVVRPGDTLTVFGFGFGVSLGACRVFLDSVAVLPLKVGSDDRRLVFDIPASLESTIPAAGRPAALRVVGFRGSAQAVIQLRPSRLVIRGGVEFAFLDATPAPPAAIVRGAAAAFQYSVRSTASGDATIQLQPTFAGVIDATPWLQQAFFTDAAGATIANGRITLAANEGNRRFRLALRQVPATADARFQVGVRGASDDGLVSGQSESRPFEIGAAQEPQDPDITLTVAGVTFGRQDETGAIVPVRGRAAVVTVRARLIRAGTYAIPAPAFTGGGWSSSVAAQTFAVQALPAEGFLEPLFQFDVQPADNATSPALVTFRMKRDAAANGRTLPLTLKTPPP